MWVKYFLLLFATTVVLFIQIILFVYVAYYRRRKKCILLNNSYTFSITFKIKIIMHSERNNGRKPSVFWLFTHVF